MVGGEVRERQIPDPLRRCEPVVQDQRWGTGARVGEAQRGDDDQVSARVTLEPVRSQDPMYWISGTSSSIVLETEMAGTVEITERDGLLTQTAYAVYADLLTIAATAR